LDEHELAWAAGFFDGDGWAAYVNQKGRKTGQPHAQINQAGADGMPEVLERFAAAVGVGSLHGPRIIAKRLPLYNWAASSAVDVLTVHELLGPYLSPVKARQVAAAARSGRATTSSMRTESTERAWAAGFFDAEGNVSLSPHRSHAGHFLGEAAVTQTSGETRSGELERFRASVGGLGKIYGPYQNDAGGARVYRWKLPGPDSIAALLHCLGPWLGALKTSQFHRALRVLGEQPELPRGNPSWGNRKTHCKNGHEYATARIRPYRARSPDGVEPRPSHQCLVCVREAAFIRRRLRDDWSRGRSR